jgi:gliding motility-associated-like protein
MKNNVLFKPPYMKIARIALHASPGRAVAPYEEQARKHFFYCFTFLLFLLNAGFSQRAIASAPFPLLMVDAGPDRNICLGDTVQLEATGATSYQWLPATGLSCTNCPNPLAFPDTSTLYIVVANDGTVDSVQVSVFEQPHIVSIAKSNPTVCNLPNGAIVITASGSTALEYSINGGGVWQNTGVFTALAAGVYSPVVRNANGACDPVAGGNLTLTSPAAAQILNIIETDPTLCDIPNGAIVISAVGGVSPLLYSIDGGVTWQNQNTFQLLGAGIYNPAVQNANFSCQVNSPQVTLTGAPNEAIITQILTFDPSNCNQTDGIITILIANDDGNYEYSINGGISYQASNSFAGLDEGLYFIFVRRNDGTCRTSGGYVELESNNRPVIFGVSKVNPSGCGAADGNITILAFGPSTLEFSIDGGSNWQGSNIFNGLSAGAFPVAVRNNDGSCETSGDTETLTAPAAPVITGVSFNNPSACGLSDGSISIAATGSNPLEYSINNGVTWSQGAQFSNLAEGSYSVLTRYAGGGCQTAYSLNPVLLDASGTAPVINNIAVVNPGNCGAANGSLTINASGSGSLLFGLNGGALQPGNNFQNLSAGVYTILVTTVGGNCPASATATLTAAPGCTDTVLVSIPSAATVYCLDPSVFDIPGSISAAGICGQGNANTVFATSINLDCVTLTPASGFAGTSPDLICVVHCFNNSAAQCDTTYLRVTVQGVVNCDDVFTSDTVNAHFFSNPTAFCIPLSPTIANQFDLFFNGAPLNNPFDCDFDSTVVYTYAFIPGGGVFGPYSLNSWTVDGNVYSGFFNNAQELLLLMNAFDPTGNWQLNAQGAYIFGGNLNSDYGNMNVTQTPSGATSIMMTNYSILPQGFTVFLPAIGVHTLVAVNPNNGCADTLYIDASFELPGTETIHLTTYVNEPTDTICLTGEDLPGNAIVNLGYCINASNGVAPVLNDSCVYYFPNFSYAGQDTFCIVVCDGGFPQVCDTTVFIVNVLPQHDTVFLNLPPGVTSVDTCLSDFIIELPGTIQQAAFCGINANELSGTINQNCLTFNTVGGFSGVSEVCVVFCSGSVCDTTTVIVNVEPPIICNDIFTTASVTITSPVSTGFLCIPVSTGDIVSFTVTLDGAVYGQSFIPCGGAGSQITVHGFGSHELILLAGNGCADTVTVILEQHFVSTETLQVSTSLNTTVSPICINTNDLIGNLLSLNFCTLPPNGSVGLVNNTCVSYTPGLNFTGSDQFCLVVCDDYQPQVCDTFIVIVTVEVPTDTVFVIAPGAAPFDTCLDGTVLQLPGSIAMAAGCGIQASEVNLILNGNCITIDLNDNFNGTTTACVVHCTADTPPICDTTILVISTQPANCPPIFNPDQIQVALISGVGQVCLPVPFNQILQYEIDLDGANYTGPLAGCDFDSIYSYPYSLIPGQGNAGPYNVTWLANGATFTATVPDLAALVAQMNLWDPAGDWTLDPTTLSIISTNDNGVYGNLSIQQAQTGNMSIIGSSFNETPYGAFVTFSGSGQHEIVLTEIATACYDTLFINAVEAVNVLNISTLEDQPSTIVCLDTTGLPGNFVSTTVCQQPANGDFIINLDCFTYNPDNGFIGNDQGCLVVCDDLGNCDTTLVFITVEPLCSLYDLFPDGQQIIAVASCADVAAWCVPLPLDSVANFNVFDNGALYAGGFLPCNTTQAQISLDTGQHVIVFQHLNTGCSDTLQLNVTCQPTSNSCGIAAQSPLMLDAPDCDSPVQFCVSVTAFEVANFYVVSDNGAAATIAGCDPFGIQAAAVLDTGFHQLIFVDTAKGCSDTFEVTVNCLFLPGDTLDYTLELGDELVLCFEDFGFDTSAIDSIVNTCPLAGNVNFVLDETTWCVTLTGAVAGADTLCFKVFANDTCSFLVVQVNAIEPCPDLFPDDLITVAIPCSLDSGLVCLPLGEEAQENKIYTVNGQPYTGDLLPCDLQSLFFINYNDLPSSGLLGPYVVENWMINGATFTGTFNTAQELADSMSLWDPTGNWIVVVTPQGTLITGGEVANIYGGMQVEQTLFSIEVTLPVQTEQVAGGVALKLPQGAFAVTVTDTTTQCSESVIVKVTCISSDVVTDTIPVGETGSFCLDFSELTGQVDTVFNACAGSNGEIVTFTFANGCVSYEGNETGLDSACFVACDDLGVCDTTYFFITVELDNDSLLIASNDTVSTGEGEPLTINVLDNDVVFSLDFCNIVQLPSHGDAFYLPNCSINYVPDDGYCNDAVPDVLTYEICNENGCDTATVFIYVECTGFEIFTGFSPNGDDKNDFFTINGLQRYPEHKLFVYNRWGNLVFEATDYKNDWDGKWNGKDLPDGTYFYVLEREPGEKPLTGYVQLLR